MIYILSNHALEQIENRNIPKQIVDDILNNPDQIIDDASGPQGHKVYQSIIDFSGKGTYLVRVFVNAEKQPNVVKSVYRTSKLQKYYENKI